jgi:transcriptional antiterminator
MRIVVLKVMNNNVLLARDLTRQVECMLIGKGLGFGKKSEDIATIPKEQIERIYYAQDHPDLAAYQKRLAHIDVAIIGVCEELIVDAQVRLGELSDQLHVVFIDHIAFAIDRVKSGLVIDNPFLFEIQTLYPNEYAFGQLAVDRINREFSVYLPPDEAGFIALHLYAARQNSQVKDAVKQTRILTEIMQFIEKVMGCSLPREDFAYIRLLNHLRGALDRHKKELKVRNPLLKSIQAEMGDSFRMALQVGQFLKQEYGYDFDSQELGYLAIHIERIRTT